MKRVFLLALLSTTLIGIFLVPGIISNPIFAQNSSYFELSEDETRATTLHFSIKPLDNWAYQNAGYAPDNIFGWKPNNAVEMFPNEFVNMSMVYGMIAQDGYYNVKNAGLEHYVNYKRVIPDLKYIEESKLLSTEEININGTKTIKLTYYDPKSMYKIALYLLQHNKDNYVIYYRADTDLFNEYLPEFEQMIKTIKWIE